MATATASFIILFRGLIQFLEAQEFVTDVSRSDPLIISVSPKLVQNSNISYELSDLIEQCWKYKQGTMKNGLIRAQKGAHASIGKYCCDMGGIPHKNGKHQKHQNTVRSKRIYNIQHSNPSVFQEFRVKGPSPEATFSSH